MNKKLISILFFTAILLISCGNEDKTGSTTTTTTNNNSDLGATYSGTWNFTGTYWGEYGETLTINTDGSCLIDTMKAETVTKNSDNNYTIIFITDVSDATVSATYTLTLNITFDTVNSGTVKGNEKVVLANGTIAQNYDFNETIAKNN